MKENRRENWVKETRTVNGERNEGENWMKETMRINGERNQNGETGQEKLEEKAGRENE